MRSNAENLEAFDTLLQKITALYIVELESDIFSKKEYTIKTLKDNADKKEELSKEVDSILKNNESLTDTRNNRMSAIVNEIQFLSEEFEKTGKVIAKQYNGYMTIEFYAHGELAKEFTVKNDEYLEEVAQFIEKGYSEHLDKR